MNNISFKQLLLCALYSAIVFIAVSPVCLTAGFYGRLWAETTSLFLLTILCLNKYVPQKSDKGIFSVVCAIIMGVGILTVPFFITSPDSTQAAIGADVIISVSVCLAGIGFKINKKTAYGIIYIIITLINTLTPSLFLKHPSF